MTPFAAYTAAETPNVFQWVGQPPKIAPFPWRDLNPMVLWAHASQPRQTATIRSTVFLHGSGT